MPNRVSMGGRLQDLPMPYRRYWPESTDRRRVSISFTDWSVSIGGSHTSLKIEEEHNYIWDEQHQIWRKCWDDQKGRGFELETKFEDYATALKVAKAIVRIMFPSVTHEIIWDGKRTRYVYARQSD